MLQPCQSNGTYVGAVLQIEGQEAAREMCEVSVFKRLCVLDCPSQLRQVLWQTPSNQTVSSSRHHEHSIGRDVQLHKIGWKARDELLLQILREQERWVEARQVLQLLNVRQSEDVHLRILNAELSKVLLMGFHGRQERDKRVAQETVVVHVQ